MPFDSTFWRLMQSLSGPMVRHIVLVDSRRAQVITEAIEHLAMADRMACDAKGRIDTALGIDRVLSTRRRATAQQRPPHVRTFDLRCEKVRFASGNGPLSDCKPEKNLANGRRRDYVTGSLRRGSALIGRRMKPGRTRWGESRPRSPRFLFT
jgi:hypothetical protein